MFTGKVGDTLHIVPTEHLASVTPHGKAVQANNITHACDALGTNGAANKMGGRFIEIRERMNRAVFLDRDGVLNEAIVREGIPYPPSSLLDLVIVPDAFSSLTKLRSIGFRLIVVTNQPDIARGKISRETVDQMNAHLTDKLPIDDIEMCPHDDSAKCECRKPLPGMLLRAARRYAVELGESFMIGDRWRDIEAGYRAGCRTVLIGNGYNEVIRTKPDIVVVTLAEATDWIISKLKKV